MAEDSVLVWVVVVAFIASTLALCGVLVFLLRKMVVDTARATASYARGRAAGLGSSRIFSIPVLFDIGRDLGTKGFWAAAILVYVVAFGLIYFAVIGLALNLILTNPLALLSLAVSVALLLFAVYWLVRFVKWAWTD